MPQTPEKPKKTVTVTSRPRASSTDSSSDGTSTIAPSLKSPRTARFAEATAVNSPIEPTQTSVPQFNSTSHHMAQPQVADVGFGYLRNHHESVEMPNTDENGYEVTTPKTPLRSPLKSAMKTPGAPPRDLGKAILSPAFQEEYLEKREKHTDKQQARDVRIKTRVRMAKMLMRGVNFSCSLIVLAMLSTVFTIFNATRSLPSRGSFSAWAPGQKIWPQVTLLVIACISLFMSVLIIYAYWKGGHKRAEKAAVYYTAFAVVFFIFSIVMWGIGAGILQGSRQSSDGKDMWSWSCADNTRKQLYQNDVDYDLMCRLQSWSLICAIIEIVVETVTIAIYGIVFYRYYSKRQLRKSMANRDRARSDLYLSQLRAQSAPNTPGLVAPYSARDGGWKPPADYYASAPDVEEGNTQYVNADQKRKPKPFQLQAPPIKLQTATPRMEQVGFSPVQTQPRARTPSPPEEVEDMTSPLMPSETQQEHFHAAPGEQVYEYVPPPGAYEPPPLSPGAEVRSPRFAR